MTSSEVVATPKQRKSYTKDLSMMRFSGELSQKGIEKKVAAFKVCCDSLHELYHKLIKLSDDELLQDWDEFKADSGAYKIFNPPQNHLVQIEFQAYVYDNELEFRLGDNWRDALRETESGVDSE